MRKIKFRGKAKMSIEELNELGLKHEKGWVYGNLIIENDNEPIIMVDPKWWVVVEPKSVGQYTGLKDKNGTPIYEGDIVTVQSFESSMLNHWKYVILKYWDYEVEYVPEMYVIKCHEASFKTFDLEGKWVAILKHHVSGIVEDLQVVGNIYENPDLLKDKE